MTTTQKQRLHQCNNAEQSINGLGKKKRQAHFSLLIAQATGSCPLYRQAESGDVFEKGIEIVEKQGCA